MDVASLELSKELIALSGGEWLAHEVWDSDGEWFFERASKVRDYCCPRYGLGYLLRRLPKGCIALDMVGEQWRCYYEDPDTPHATFAPIPEDALAKLAIELFKQGILTKGKL